MGRSFGQKASTSTHKKSAAKATGRIEPHFHYGKHALRPYPDEAG